MSRSSSQSSTSNLDQYKNFYEDLQVEKKFSADLEVFTEAVTRLEYLHRQMISSITIYRGYETQHEGVSANYAAVARRVRDEAYDGVVTIQRQIAECRKLIVRLGESLQLNLYTKTPYEKEIAFLENINVKSSFIGSLEEYYTKEAHGEEIEDLRQKNEELIAAYDRRPKLDADQYLHDNLDKLVQEVNDTPLEEFKPHHLDVIRYVYDNAQAVINEIKQNEGDEEDDPTKQPLKKALAATKGSGSFTLFTSKTVKDTEYSIVELSKNASGAKAKGFVNKKLLEKVNQHYVADGSTDLLAEDKKEIIEAAIKLQGKVYIKAKSQGEAKNAAYYNKQFTEYCENKCKGRARALVVTQTAADEDVDFNLGEDKDDNEISIMYAPIMTDGMTDKYIGYNLGPGIKSMIGAVDDFVRRHIHSNYSPVNETACNSGKIKNWWSAMFMRGEATRHVIKVQDGSTETKVLGSVRPGTNLSTLYNKKDKPTNEMSLQEKREAAFLLMQAADTLIDFLDHCEKKGDMIPRGCDFKPVVWKDEKGKIQARFFLLDVDHASFLTQDAMEKSQLGGANHVMGQPFRFNDDKHEEIDTSLPLAVQDVVRMTQHEKNNTYKAYTKDPKERYEKIKRGHQQGIMDTCSYFCHYALDQQGHHYHSNLDFALVQSSDKVNKSKNPSWEEKVETHRERFTKIKENLQMQTVYVNENAKTHDNIKSGGKYTVIHSINNYSYEPDKKVYLQRGDNYFELLPADLVRGNVNAANVAEFKRKDNSAVKQNVLQFKDTAALESDQPQSPMPVIKWVAEVRKNLNANPQENEHSVFASRKLMKADDRINDGINDVELGLTPRTSDIDKTSMVRAMVRQVVFEILQAECPAENSAYLMNNVLGTQKIGLIDVEVSEQYKGEFIKIAKEYAEEVHVTSISPAAA